MNNNFKISFISNLPLEGDSPKVFINTNKEEEFVVEFINGDNNEILNTKKCKSGEIIFGGKQWFINWYIKIYNISKTELVYEEKYNAEHKLVFIKIDASALGDNIAWISYIEEFRKKHNCNVICSTFYNDLFIDSFPNIYFVKPNIEIKNVYAQYYIGAHKKDNIYSPIDVKSNSLQKVASTMLGLEHKEIRPKLENVLKNTKRRIEGKYVCISEFASHEKKHWREIGGWQKVVDFLNSINIKVVVISKEKTKLKNVIDFSGEVSLYYRMLDLYHSDLFIGVSSGLSWLAWSVNCKVLMISDGTPVNHEFKENCIRISKENIGSVDFENYKNHTNYKDVIFEIKNFFK